MTLRDVLLKKKSVLVEQWLDRVLKSYPSDAKPFLKNSGKQFTNPVGYTLAEGLELCITRLLTEEEHTAIVSALENIIRLRAVQDLSPSQSLAFLFHLKTVIRDVLAHDAVRFTEELHALDARIDVLTLAVFDLYMQCREKIYDLKANEVKNMTFRLLQRANLLCEIPGQ